jgi:hypothetical protein
MTMERKKISEVAELKIKNCNLSLQILQMHANQIVAERDKVLTQEFQRLDCSLEEWRLDEVTWELVKKEMDGNEKNIKS